MNLLATPHPESQAGPFGVPWFHPLVMTVLIGFATVMVWMYVHKMQRAALQLQGLTGGNVWLTQAADVAAAGATRESTPAASQATAKPGSGRFSARRSGRAPRSAARAERPIPRPPSRQSIAPPATRRRIATANSLAWIAPSATGRRGGPSPSSVTLRRNRWTVPSATRRRPATTWITSRWSRRRSPVKNTTALISASCVTGQPRGTISRGWGITNITDVTRTRAVSLLLQTNSRIEAVEVMACAGHLLRNLKAKRRHSAR